MHTTPCSQCTSPIPHPPAELGLLRADLQCKSCGSVESIDLSTHASSVLSPAPTPDSATLLGDLQRAEIMQGWEDFQPNSLESGYERPLDLFGPVGTDLSQDLSSLQANSPASTPSNTSVTDSNLHDLLVAPSDLYGHGTAPKQASPPPAAPEMDGAARQAFLKALDAPISTPSPAARPPRASLHAHPHSSYRSDELELAPVAPAPPKAAASNTAMNLERDPGALHNGRTSRAYRRSGTFIGRSITWIVGFGFVGVMFFLLYISFSFVASLTGHHEYTDFDDGLIPAYEKHRKEGFSGAEKTIESIKFNAKESFDEFSKGKRVKGRYTERYETRPDGTKVLVWVPRNEEGDPKAKGKRSRGASSKRSAASKDAPEFSLRRADKAAIVSKGTLKGRKTVLNFYATWCPPCRKEIPAFSAFAHDQKDRSDGVQVYGVVLKSGSKSVALKKSQGLGVDYPILMGTQSVARAFGVRALPTTVVLDEEGRILKTVTGEMNATQLAKATGQR